MRLLFDKNMTEHLIAMRQESGRSSGRLIRLIDFLLQIKLFVIVLFLFENVLTRILVLPIPGYRWLIRFWVINYPGLPSLSGMYIRAAYYRGVLGGMGSNVFIEQGAQFDHPKSVFLDDFAFIDKGVLISADYTVIGRRVHIAPHVFITGGGRFEIAENACVAAKSIMVTSTEVLKNGWRASGPMTAASERKVFRGGIRVERDAFLGAACTVLPGVTVKEGSVVGAGEVISRDTEAWGVYAQGRPKRVSTRDRVIFDDS